MTEKLIHIEKRYDNKSAAGKPYLKIVDGQSTYSCWETSLFPRLAQGSTVNCRIETNGKYTNILDILPDDGQVKSPQIPNHVQEMMADIKEIKRMLEDLTIEANKETNG